MTNANAICPAKVSKRARFQAVWQEKVWQENATADPDDLLQQQVRQWRVQLNWAVATILQTSDCL